jgi:hypothetical protein
MLDRLDKKYPPYELIWQDSQQLAGKVLLDNLLETSYLQNVAILLTDTFCGEIM